MVAKKTGRLAVAALSATVALVGCYDTTELKLEVRSPPTEASCTDTADRVFAERSFERVRTVSGMDMFYTPRMTASSTMALNWGIAVTLKTPDAGGGCGFELETLSADPACGIQCGLSPQRGEEYDRTLKEMALRLRQAFGPKPE